MFSGVLIYAYILIPIAFVLMLVKYKPINWLWLGFLIGSLFIGIAPYVALAYIFVFMLTKSNFNNKKIIRYNSDGSYTVYPIGNSTRLSSLGKTVFQTIGSIVAGLALLFGLFIAFIIIVLVIYQPPAGSKTM